MANVFIKSDKPNKQFQVIEQSTQYVLKTFKEYNEARSFARIHNSGGGFNGNTPPFFMIDISRLLVK